MDREKIVARLEMLQLPAGDWVVHGSAPLVLQGLTTAVNDLDIIVRGRAWQAAMALGEPVPGRQDLVVRYGDDVELWSGWLGDDVDALIDSAELVAGVPLVPLAEVLRFKERLGRPKDAAHIALLRTHLGLR